MMETRKPYGLRSSKRSVPQHEMEAPSRKRRRIDPVRAPVARMTRESPRKERKSGEMTAEKASETTREKTAAKAIETEPEAEPESEPQPEPETVTADEPITLENIKTEPMESTAEEESLALGEGPKDTGVSRNSMIAEKETGAPVSQDITVDSVLSALPSALPMPSARPRSTDNGLANGETKVSFEWSDLNSQLQAQNLPILENLAEQVLTILSKGSYQDALQISAQPKTSHGQVFASIKSLFEQSRRMYSSEDPFILVDDLNIQDASHRKAIRKSNLASFVSIAFGGSDGGFYHLNEYFLETFAPDGETLLKHQARLFLDLKTQSYISALLNSKGTRSPEEILEDVFPSDLSQKISRPTKVLTDIETEFLSQAQSRQQTLLQSGTGEEAIKSLSQKYLWEEFLKDLSAHVNRNFHELVGQPTYKATQPRPVSSLTPFQTVLQEEAKNQQSPYSSSGAQQNSYEVADLEEKSLRAAQLAMSHWESNNATVKNGDSEQAEVDLTSSALIASSYGGIPEIPYHTQSAPTQVLYERARLAATAKQSPNNRRAGLPSQRRPWTTEEENALMAGLDRVKGPHWSQILAMFGPEGTINESLKDRNQVQLKDKARNLKLFFLKSGIEVPYYLQFVTGELKTRAPGQAAKNEAKERERLNIDEDKAHIEGILALANGGRAGSSDTIDEGRDQGRDQGQSQSQGPNPEQGQDSDQGKEKVKPVEEHEEMDIDRKVLEQLANA